MRLTKEGKKFIIAAALISLAAVNTGNNLIYLILAMMLSIMAVAFWALWFNMRGLRLDISSGRPIFANSPADIAFSVENKKRLLPSFSLRLRLTGGPEVTVEGEGLIPYISPKTGVEGEARATFPKRGLYSLQGVALESGFPFIFLKKSLRMPLKKEFIVFPEIKDIGDISGASGRGGEGESHRPGESEDILYLREFRHGDDLKKISWKATAKTDRLMVWQSAAHEPRTVLIILDDMPPGDAELFEKAVSYAASAADRFIRDGYSVGLLSFSLRIPADSGNDQLYRILRSLALVKEAGPPAGGSEFPFEEEIKGMCILILKSRGSSLERFTTVADKVVYPNEI